MTDVSDAGATASLRAEILKPFFSVTILECLSDNWDRDSNQLSRFIKREAIDPGQAVSARITGEIDVSSDQDEGIDNLEQIANLGFDRLYALTRMRTHVPGWAVRESEVFDVTNELTLLLQRQRLIVIRTDMISHQSLLRWVSRPTTPLQALPPEMLMSTFIGDGRGLWLQGTHRQRTTKADNKALYGIRLQEALDAIEDASYAMSAMQIAVAPLDENSRIRGTVTISPDKSSMSFKAMPNIQEFIAVADETLDRIEKSYTSELPPDLPFPGLALREKDLTRVFSAYDVRIATPEEILTNPHLDNELSDVADLLRGSLLNVSGEPTSPAVYIEIGRDGALTGTLKVQPAPAKGGGFELDIRLSGRLYDETWTRKIRDHLNDSDLMSIFYETGHSYAERRISRQQLAMQAFNNIEFHDFNGYDICHEKPRASGDQAIHDATGAASDDSVFSWVANRYSSGWLLCDDGAGEVADFLHLSHDGTLSIIHVKGARSLEKTRRIAVTAFEELVSQAEKNVHRIRKQVLVDVLSARPLRRPACWRDGERVSGREEFIDQLQMRVSRDKTQVVLVQPHLLEAVHSAARKALDRGQPTANSHSMMLLDTLLHSTRRTITSLWDDMYVIGCT